MVKYLIDRSMRGLDGFVRIYRVYAPSITARLYKEPHWIVEVEQDD